MRKIHWGVLLVTTALTVVVVANIAIRVRAAKQQGAIVSRVRALGGLRVGGEIAMPPGAFGMFIGAEATARTGGPRSASDCSRKSAPQR